LALFERATHRVDPRDPDVRDAGTRPEVPGERQHPPPSLTGVVFTFRRSETPNAALGRLRYAQPVCEPGFADRLPPIQTPIRGLQIADTSFYYPEDRGVSESVRLAKQMAARIA